MIVKNMWTQYNPNPTGRKVGDCSVRAVSAALDIDWEDAFILLTMQGFRMGDMPSSDAVWGAVLKQHGFKREAIPNSCPDCYTAEDFAKDHPSGVYTIGFGGHVATIRDGRLMDSWDSSDEVPLYFYYKEE